MRSVLFRRGSPCILPEETLAGYEAAIDAGVDFIEMDAVRSSARRSGPVALLVTKPYHMSG